MNGPSVFNCLVAKIVENEYSLIFNNLLLKERFLLDCQSYYSQQKEILFLWKEIDIWPNVVQFYFDT